MIDSEEEFVRLRDSTDPSEYRRAAHASASIDVWTAVIRNHPRMRPWVAHNKTVPLEILRLLSEDPDPEVRGSVADKRKLDPALFARLATDPDPSVRLRLAFNPKIPVTVLERLADDCDEDIRDVALDRLASR
jgi:hypothetical protein